MTTDDLVTRHDLLAWLQTLPATDLINTTESRT